MDKEDFFISSLQHKDVILGAPCFDHVNGSRSTIPMLETQALTILIKISISCYMIFVKESLKDACASSSLKVETSEDIKNFNFPKEFQDLFTDDIPTELPPTRGIFDHTIELLPGSFPPNKPAYRVF